MVAKVPAVRVTVTQDIKAAAKIRLLHCHWVTVADAARGAAADLSLLGPGPRPVNYVILRFGKRALWGPGRTAAGGLDQGAQSSYCQLEQ